MVRAMVSFEEITSLVLPEPCWEEIQEHCKRKLAGHYLHGESKGRKAYGLVAGIQNGFTLKVERILAAKRNVREEEPYKTYMDKMMEQHAIPSKTPLRKRGWITDPVELKQYYDKCDQDGLLVFGTYHMHVVPWEHDPVRDTPTSLDTALAQDSNLFSLIVSMVDVSRPSIRAFYEGVREKELPILFEEG
jgi:hypothetical protein